MNTFCVIRQLQSCNLCFPQHYKVPLCKHFTNVAKRSKDNLKETINASNKSVSKDLNVFHITDKKLADQVVSELRLGDDIVVTPIIETNPGTGVLTRKLLQNQFLDKLFVFEPRKNYIPQLETLIPKKNQEKRFEIIPHDFFYVLKQSSARAKQNAKLYYEIFDDFPTKDWNNGFAMKIISVLSPKMEGNFLRYLCAKLPLFDIIFSQGRCQFFLFMSEKEYKYMVSKPKERMSLYLGVSVIFQLFFDIELIDKIPHSCFEPKIFRKASIINEYDRSISCFVKLTPKKELPYMVSEGRLPDLFTFVKQNMVTRNNLVIAALESWIPDCGPRIIKNGLPVFTKFGDLSPPEILDIFKLFSSWPEYEDCAFKTTTALYSHAIEDDD